MLIDEMITAGHARALLAIDDEDKMLELANRCVKEKLTVRDIERLSKEKDYIDSIIKENAEKANYYATKTLRKVQKKVGFPERIR